MPHFSRFLRNVYGYCYHSVDEGTFGLDLGDHINCTRHKMCLLLSWNCSQVFLFKIKIEKTYLNTSRLLGQSMCVDFSQKIELVLTLLAEKNTYNTKIIKAKSSVEKYRLEESVKIWIQTNSVPKNRTWPNMTNRCQQT